MTDLRAAAQQALEALERSETTVPYDGFGMERREAERKHEEAIAALRAALAQEADPHPPSRHCMCDACKPAFEPTPGPEEAGPSRTQRMRDAGYTRRPTVREMAEKGEPLSGKDALRLADELDAELRRTVRVDMLHHNAAAKLRRLVAQRDALLEAMVVAHDQLIGLQPIIANGLLTKQQLAFIDPNIDVAMETLVAAIKAVEEGE